MFRRYITLALRGALDAHRRRSFREETVFKFGFGDRYVASHEFGERLGSTNTRTEQQDRNGDDQFHVLDYADQAAVLDSFVGSEQR